MDKEENHASTVDMHEKKNNGVMIRCHFCTKSIAQVKKIFMGSYACICNECVAACVNTMAGVDVNGGDSHGKS